MIASIQAGVKCEGDSKATASPASQLFADALGTIFQAEGQPADNPTVAVGPRTKSGKFDSLAKSGDTPENPEAKEQASPVIAVPDIVPAALPLANTPAATTKVEVPTESPANPNQLLDASAVTVAFIPAAADLKIPAGTNTKGPTGNTTSAETPTQGSDVECQDRQPTTDLIPEPISADALRSTTPGKAEALPTIDAQPGNHMQPAPEISSPEILKGLGVCVPAVNPGSYSAVPAPMRISPKSDRKIEPDSSAAAPSNANEVTQPPAKHQSSEPGPSPGNQFSKSAVLTARPETPREPVPEPPLGELRNSPHRPAPKDGEMPPDVEGDLAPEKTLKSIDAQLVSAQSEQPTARVQTVNDRIVEPSPTIITNHLSSESGSTLLKQNDPAPNGTARPSIQEPLSLQFNDLRSEPGAVHLVSKLEHQELRFGWNSQDFGRIEVRTTLEHDRVGAIVSVPDAHLRDSLQAEIGSLNRALASHSLELSQFSAFDSSTPRDANREQDSQSQTGSPNWNAKGRNQASSLTSKNVIRAHAGLLDLRA